MTDIEIQRAAIISDCTKYRYWLSRYWEPEKISALFVMLNPSTANADIDDATIRSCIRLCREWDYGGFEVVNLFGFRATDPKALSSADDPVGPDNKKVATEAIERCDVVICAWGAHKIGETQAPKMRELIASKRIVAFCLDVTQSGAPKHPLYIKSGTPLMRYL